MTEQAESLRNWLSKVLPYIYGTGRKLKLVGCQVVESNETVKYVITYKKEE